MIAADGSKFKVRLTSSIRGDSHVRFSYLIIKEKANEIYMVVGH